MPNLSFRRISYAMARFAHMSDVHLGSWSSHPDLKEYPLKAFESAVDRCIGERVDFVVIAGDFFDTSLPAVDVIRKAVQELKRLKDAGIPVYAIPGSHDFSPAGKSMFNVLEDAGLLTNVARMREGGNGHIILDFTTDPGTGVKLCGILGRRGAMEKGYFENLDRGIEQEEGPKIFVFHSGIGEFGIPAEMLPQGFDYYASGHIHSASYDPQTRIAFPGPLFPADFPELEQYDSGFWIVDLGREVKRAGIRLFEVCMIRINADGKSSSVVQSEMEEKIGQADLKGKILLVKAEGTVRGMPEINTKDLVARALGKGALCVKKSIKLASDEIQVRSEQHGSVEEMESKIAAQAAESARMPWLDAKQTEELVLSLMSALKQEKQDDELEKNYAERVRTAARKVLNEFSGHEIHAVVGGLE